MKNVEELTLANIEDLAGVAIDDKPASAGGQWLDLEVPQEDVAVEVKVTANATTPIVITINSTVLGVAPGRTCFVLGGVFGKWAVKAIQTIANLAAGTSTLVQGVWIKNTSQEAQDSRREFFNHWNARGGAAEWTETLVNSSTPACDPTIEGGALKIINAAGDNDSVTMQSAFAFYMLQNRAMHFKARVKWKDANNNAATVEQVDTFVGVSVTDTDFEAGRSDGSMVFGTDDGDAILDFDHKGSAAEVKTAITSPAAIVADTWYKLEMVWDGTKLTPYVDGVAGTAVTATTELPLATNLLRVSIEHQNGEAVAKTLLVDYIGVKAGL